MPTARPATYDIAIQWPSQRDDWHAVASRGAVPLYGRPHGFDPARNTVWIAWRGEIVGRFKVSEIRRRKLRLLTGGEPKTGAELLVRPGSVRKLRPPRAVTDISDPGRLSRAWRGGTFKHLTPGASTFVNSPDAAPPRKKRNDAAEVEYIGIQKEWLGPAKVQRSMTEEHIAYGVEARLVVQYADWLEARRGHPALTRHQITLDDGTRLLSDAWDEERRLLIEAKAGIDRPSIRMAIGQLLDYSQNLAKTVKLAVLLPAKPSQNLLSLMRAQRIEAIWQTPSGQFSDSRNGELAA